MNKGLVKVILYLELCGTCDVQYMPEVSATSQGAQCSEGSLVLYTHPSSTSTSGVTVGGRIGNRSYRRNASIFPFVLSDVSPH